MITNDAAYLADTCRRFGITIPKPADVAQKAYEAAQALANEVHTADRPTVAGLTAETVREKWQAILSWQGKESREAAADQLVTEAGHALELAWLSAAPDLMPKFAPAWSKAQAAYEAALAALGGTVNAEHAVAQGLGDDYNTAHRAADDLASLAMAWHLCYPRRETNTARGRLAAPIVTTDDDTARHALRAYEQPGQWSAQWLAGLLAVPGVSLAWPTERKAPSPAADKDPANA